MTKGKWRVIVSAGGDMVSVEMLNASEDVVDLALFAVLANKFYCRRSHNCHFCAYPLERTQGKTNNYEG